MGAMNSYLEKKMRLQVLLLFSSSELGGAERSLTRMAIVPTEIDYHFATLDGQGPWCDWIRHLGKTPITFGCTTSAQEQFSLWKKFVLLLRYIRHNNINVVYVCGFRAALVLRWLKVFMPGVKLVQGVRWNPDSDSNLDRGFRFVERWSHGLVDGYITNSRVAVDTLIRRCKIPAERIQVIYNGLANLPDEVPLMTERPMEVLTVANLNARKGYLEYLDVIRMVLDVIPGVRFVFVGRDDMNGKVQRAIENEGLSHAITYEGFQADTSEYFRRARVFVLPSLWNEGCPTVLLESFAWACPVVGYEIDGVPELIDSGDDGYIVPVRDKYQLASHIIALLRNEDLASKYGNSGRKKVESRFGLDASAKLHEDTLKQFCKDK